MTPPHAAKYTQSVHELQPTVHVAHVDQLALVHLVYGAQCHLSSAHQVVWTTQPHGGDVKEHTNKD